MANVLNTNPMTIDTLSASVLLTDDLFIRAMWIQWGATAVAGDNIVVQDKNGNLVWNALASGADAFEPLSFSAGSTTGPFKMAGLKVPTLTAGHGNILHISLA